MFGFALAAGCALGLYLLSRNHRHHHGMRRILDYAFFRLDTTSGQEKVLRSALLRLKGEGETLRQDLKNSRPELAEVLAADQFDQGRVERWLADRERTFSEVKPHFVEALKEMHDVLDPEQRRKLGKWVESGPGRPFAYGRRRHGMGAFC